VPLLWSVTAMKDTTERLAQVTAWHPEQAFAAIGEAVWWVTIVDATLGRHHLDAYDRVMVGQASPERQLAEETLAGLRFVRNQIGDEVDLADFIAPNETSPDTGNGSIVGWTWKPVPTPKLTALAPLGRAGR
jgi:hypothetical protein